MRTSCEAHIAGHFTQSEWRHVELRQAGDRRALLEAIVNSDASFGMEPKPRNDQTPIDRVISWPIRWMGETACGYRKAQSAPSIITGMNRSAGIDSKKSLDGRFEGDETPLMENKDTGTVHLRRIDPSQNMRRFYTLAIQPTLFGGASVIRNWGRIGTSGQSKVETFDSHHDAAGAAVRLQKAKRRKGYVDDSAM